MRWGRPCSIPEKLIQSLEFFLESRRADAWPTEVPWERVPSPGEGDYMNARGPIVNIWHADTRKSPEAAERKCDRPATPATGVHSMAR